MLEIPGQRLFIQFLTFSGKSAQCWEGILTASITLFPSFLPPNHVKKKKKKKKSKNKNILPESMWKCMKAQQNTCITVFTYVINIFFYLLINIKKKRAHSISTNYPSYMISNWARTRKAWETMLILLKRKIQLEHSLSLGRKIKLKYLL